MTLAQRCQPIELILSDVDGVLTDGSIIYDNQGIETKRFFVRDGLGIRLWQRAGGRFGLITARSSHIVKVRATELGIEILRQGSEQKRSIAQQIAGELGLSPQKICYIGDDLPDLAVLQHVGLAVAVADACAEVREAAHYVTTAGGGRGAVRETIELILKVQRRWDDIVQKYRQPAADAAAK
jgi:YrbI family 3-deoxy-D-manno-octulosonate 8-phosphate phosphatase